MPFDCALDGPRLVLRPSDVKRYPVIGEREERQITACATPGSSECRTLKAHRFSISCGGRRIPWMRVVAAARRTATHDMWLEGGRIHLAVERRTGAPGRCADGSRRSQDRHPGEGPGGSRFGLPNVDCLPWQGERDTAHVALPPGFAPLGEIGAKIVVGHGGSTMPSPPASTRIDAVEVAALPERRELKPPVQPLTNAPGVEKAFIPVEFEPQADVSEATTIPVVLTGADQSRTWVTMVRPEAIADPMALLRGPTSLVWTAATLLAALLAAGAWAMWRSERSAAAVDAGPRGPDGGLRHAFRGSAAPFQPAGAPPTTTTTVTNAAASVTALIEQANGSLDVLRGAPPLREVLEQELSIIRQRLAIVKAQASEGPEAAHRAAPAFRSLVRDLERVRRISESAALTFSGGRVKARLPRTRSEAYDVLGVHGDVSEQTLKKLVDALRMCWHPDLARDEADRVTREERIKCINVAWELISGKRTAV